MKSPAFRESRIGYHSRCGERGVTMVLVALAMVAIIAMAALSIDVITLYLAREEAQRSADAAALAGARVISLSGMTGDPNNTATWGAICGGSGSPATQTATAVGMQGAVGGTVANTVTVNYSVGTNSAVPDCTTLPAAFGINPIVTVHLSKASLPTFFSRIWGGAGNSVSATAAAEVFNPSNSGSVAANIIPVQPSCVKPWIVPNHDPWNPGVHKGVYCDQTGNNPGQCNTLVNTSDGSITTKGISLEGGSPGTGVIGETFWLVSDCHYTGSACNLRDNPVLANHGQTGHIQGPYNLEYLPGQTVNPSSAVPSCGSVGSGGSADYEPAIAGCDQSTLYQCGVQNNNSGQAPMVDLSENPATSGDTTNGVQCLIHEGDPTDRQPDGQDALSPYAAPGAYPFQILAGSSSPLGLSGNPITASNSIVSVPIYDDAKATYKLGATGTTSVTIVGFLQVFINAVDQDGNVSVTVLNVAGCSNGKGGAVSSSPITGTSPVPIRLITPP
jgi:Flp pilus assembly protein TadG